MIIGVLAATAIPQHHDYVTRARWADNLQTVAPLKQAIAECFQNNNGAATNCDTVTELVKQGFIPAGYTLPTPPFAAGPITLNVNTSAIVLVSDAAAGGCTVNLTPGAGAGTSFINWQFSNAGACNRAKTGVVT